MPFIDPIFKNNVILTGTERLTMNTRPKIPANARNLNCCIIGSSGSGKSRFWLTPNLLQAHSSYIVVDPKGSILDNVGSFLTREGYKIKVFNSIDFPKSMHYNPLAYIKTEADILKFVTALIQNTKGDGKEGDEFWSKCEQLLYSALIAYIIFESPEEDRNIITLVDLINRMEVKEDNDDFKNAVDYMFIGLAKRKPSCFAVRQYQKYKLSSGKTARSILISCGARLAPFDIGELREVMRYDEMDLDLTGGRLPHHVRVLWDEAANTGQVPHLEKLVAVIRSREISLCLFLQAQSQLKALYKDHAETILGNMDSVIFLGGREHTTVKELSEALSKETISMQTESHTRGQSESYGQNVQRLGKELMTIDEVTVINWITYRTLFPLCKSQLRQRLANQAKRYYSNHALNIVSG